MVDSAPSQATEGAIAPTQEQAAAEEAIGTSDSEDWGFEIDPDYIQFTTETVEHDGFALLYEHFKPKADLTTSSGKRKLRPGHTIVKRIERRARAIPEDETCTSENHHSAPSQGTQQLSPPPSRISQGKSPFGSNHPDDWWAWRNQIDPDRTPQN